MPAVRKSRETFVTLRAMQTAVRVAREVAYPSVDVNRLFCDSCKREVDWRRAQSYVVCCPHCGQPIELPLHLRALIVVPREGSIVWELPPRVHQGWYAVQPPAEPEWETPYWLQIFFASLLVVVGVGLIWALCRLH